MAKIIWKGIIKDEEEFPAAEIPRGACKLDGEEDMKKMQIKALPFMLPSMFVCLLCMFAKTFAAGERVVDLRFVFVGVGLGIGLMIVHELLHAVGFPREAVVYIGVVPKSLTAVALSPSPVKRNRFIFLSLLPLVLGIVPLAVFCLSAGGLKELNGCMFGMAVMGMVSVYPDIYNVYHILRRVPADATIQNNKNETYYYR